LIVEERLQRRVQRYGWDRAASVYQSSWERNLAPAHEHLLEAADLRRGENVLDVACGTGLVTFAAAEAVGTSGKALGVDLSGKMIEEASRLAADLGLSNTTFRRMDAGELDLPGDEFDVVLCALGLMYLPDPRQAIAEFQRILKPGGRCVSVVWGRRDRCGWAEIFPITDRLTKSDVCPLFFQLGTGDNLAHAYASSGFKDINATRVALPFRFESGAEACVAQLEGGAVSLAYSRFDDQTKKAVQDEYLASVEKFADGSGYTIPSEFVVVRGIKASSRGIPART